MKKPRNILLIIAAMLLVAIAFNIVNPVSKQDVIEIAKSRICSVKFLLKYQQDDFESCISIIDANYFKGFSLDDKKDIAINFILYSDLQGGRAVIFLDMIAPYKDELIKSLEDISDAELTQQYQISEVAINKYRQTVKQYKKSLDESVHHR